jgi:hypothetical protein
MGPGCVKTAKGYARTAFGISLRRPAHLDHRLLTAVRVFWGNVRQLVVERRRKWLTSGPQYLHCTADAEDAQQSFEVHASSFPC